MTSNGSRFRTAILLIAGFLFSGNQVSAQDTLPGPFYGLGGNIQRSFTGTNLLLQVGAIASTYGIVQAGWDYDVHHYFHDHQEIGTAGTPAATVGVLAPVALAGGLYTYGWSSDQSEIVVAGNAVAQAVAISFLYHELLKSVTGRPAPQGVPESQMEDHSREFRFGFLRGGLFWGWPSGHLITNTAAVTSLSAFYPDSKALEAVQYGWIGYMFYGVVTHNGASMHWFSDAVAGTMMGWSFGRTVGTNYHDRLHPAAKPTLSDRIHLGPAAIDGAPGVGLLVELE